VNHPDVKRVRELAVAMADTGIAEDQVTVEHAIGNLARPMTNRELEGKFRDQAASRLVPDRLNEIIALCWKVDTPKDCRRLIAVATPA
jgi:2-methylcitrate dehydratase PrpD